MLGTLESLILNTVTQQIENIGYPVAVYDVNKSNQKFLIFSSESESILLEKLPYKYSKSSPCPTPTKKKLVKLNILVGNAAYQGLYSIL